MIKALFAPSIVLAYISYIISASLLLILSVRMMLHVQSQSANHWFLRAWTVAYLDHIWLPLSRIFALIIFLLIAYPALFNTSSPPALNMIILSWSDINSLINLMFFTGLVLPLIPIVGNLHAVTVPVQGCAAVALIFSWLAESQQIQDTVLYPGHTALFLMIAFAIAGHSISSHIARWLGHALDSNLNYEGFTHLLYPSVLLIFQAPIIITYSINLGRQLAP